MPEQTHTSAVTGHVERPGVETPVLVRPEESCAFVVFGASGDLTTRKLIPAIYNLAAQDLLPSGFAIIGFAITEWNDAEFRREMLRAVKQSPEVGKFKPAVWDKLAGSLHYIAGDFENPRGYARLGELLKDLDAECGCAGNRLFYMATAPSFFDDIVRNLGRHGFVSKTNRRDVWNRIIVEKPFGRDLDSARKLNAMMHRVFREEQIYRIDHYLGKDTVQNILAFRFANSIIEPIWNRHYIDHVQVTAAESLGVGHRGKYYEEAGALRDMFQNHLMQLLALVAMEPPVRCDPESVRDHKTDVLKAIVPFDPEQLGDVAVRGQYGPGNVDGENAPGYRQEPGVAAESGTETYAALKMQIDNWRWADVPFYLRSGKRMPKKVTEIVIQFRRAPHMFFPTAAYNDLEPNQLLIRIQPDEGISLRLGAKMPGPEMYVQQVQMNFSYGAAFGDYPATAYETLLLDAMQGDPTLFNRSDAVELAWEVLAPVLDTWEATRPFTHFPNYAAGAWGPESADNLLSRNGLAWKNG